MNAELTGAKELRNLIAELPKRVVSKGLRKGLMAGSAPILKEAKRSAPKLSGNLRRAMARKVSVKKGAGFAVIGAKRQAGKEGKVASRYLHLVEKGTAARANHPGFAGRGFMARAEANQGPLAMRLVQGILLTTVRTEAMKLGAK